MSKMNVLERTINIDSPVPPKEDYVQYSIETVEEAREFIANVHGTSLAIYLDIQGCSNKVFGILLNFFEEYSGSIEVVANDPVPLTVLSRFRTINVSSMSEEVVDTLESFRWKFQPTSIKTRMNSLFGTKATGKEYGNGR